MKHSEPRYYSVTNDSKVSISYESCYRGKIEITRDKKGKVTSRKIIR